MDIRSTQAVVMTPKLQQAIRLLGLNIFELKNFLEQELLQNPILDFSYIDGVSELSRLEDSDLINDTQGAIFGRVGTDSFDLGRAENATDVDYRESYNNYGRGNSIRNNGQEVAFQGCQIRDWSGGGTGLFARNLATVNSEQILSTNNSLKDYVLDQISLVLKEPALLTIGRELIENLDEAGYLIEDTASIAAQLGIEQEMVDAVLDKMQRLDPPGIFARDLGECLSLQLLEKNRLDPAMQTLVKNLSLLVNIDIPQICECCEVNSHDAIDMISELKALNPKPGIGIGFDHEVAAPVIPDVFVTKSPNGGWNVELNNDNLPRLLVNRQYYNEVNSFPGRKEDRTYIQGCLQSANWLIRSLNQRTQTIQSVVSEIVRQQGSFLDYGVRELRPLNLRSIADIVGIHESTVSRVVSNKYMATPRGIFALKYFFSSALAASDGGDKHSSESVRDQLRDLIGNEEANAVLSDEELVDILGRKGVGIACRTMAKYPNNLGIPSSSQRRLAIRMATFLNS